MQSAKSALMSYGTASQRTYIQPAYQQNLSGSDTDVSTSNENLTAEEKRVLQNGIRQEPQGEETIVDDIDASSMNTLIIHGSRLSNVGHSAFYLSSPKGSTLANENTLQDKMLVDQNDASMVRYSSRGDIHGMSYGSAKSNGNNSVPSSPKTAHRKNVYKNLQKSSCHGSLQHFPTSAELLHTNPHLLNANSPVFYPSVDMYGYSKHSVQDMANISRQCLDQSEALNLADDVKYQQETHGICNVSNQLPHYSSSKWQMPDYAKIMGGNPCLRYNGAPTCGNVQTSSPERFPVSRSHPNLTHVGKNSQTGENVSAKLSLFAQRPETRGRAAVGVHSESEANQLIELLSAENLALKNELDLYYKKVSKLQKFEAEIQKVHQSHEDLVRSTEKREKLERAIRMKLEMEVRRLQEQNKDLKDNLDSATSHLSKRPVVETDSELRKELSKREVLIAQLLTQNKELLAEKEQQEILLQAQRATLQEQRNHIDILDNALTNAQTNVVKLEEENRKKQVYVERVAQLQKAMTSLQQSSERRLQMEKKVRLQLEKEVEALRQKKGGKPESPVQRGEVENNESLKKTVLEYEKKIISLEAEVSKWEQRYIEESTMRQIAVDAASVPKDAKIAALERTSQESEKLIAQARSEKLKHMDELYAANRRCAEFEGRIKDFESKLAEKDAMIKVLQQHSQSKDAVLQHAVLGRPPRHTRAASTVGITTSTNHTTTTTGTSCFGRSASSSSTSNILHRRTASKTDISASGSLLSISSESSSITSPSESSPVAESVTGSQKSLDEQLKELDSRLSSKDSIISALRAEKERYPSHFWRV